MMNAQFLHWLQGLIASGNAHPFYVSSEWRKLSAEVQRIDRGECQICRARGRYHRAELVHHVNHVRHRPELALDIYYTDADGKQKRNLISVCKWCHENVCHPERLHKQQKHFFTTQERWD